MMIPQKCDRNQAEFPEFSFESEEFQSICWFDDFFEHDDSVFHVRRPRPARRTAGQQRTQQPSGRQQTPFVKSVKVCRSSANSRFTTQQGHSIRLQAVMHPPLQQKSETTSDTTEAPDSSPTPRNDKPAVGRFQRVAPRTDLHGQKRRRRLNRLRERVRQEATEDQNTAADNRERNPQASIEGLADDRPATQSKLSGSVVQRRSETFEMPLVAADARPAQTDDGRAANHNESDVAGSYRVLLQPEPEEEQETYTQWFRRVIARSRWMTWFTAFYLHWLIFLVMATIVIAVPGTAAHLLLQGTVSERMETAPPAFEVTPAIEPLAEETETEALTDTLMPSLEILPEMVTVDSLPVDTTGAVETSEPQQTSRVAPPVEPAPHPVPVDTPADAVEAGSFSAWTEPAQPRAGEPYRIIVQLRLPPDCQRYRASDLQGIVQGSDGYRKFFPAPNTGDLKIHNGYVRFIVPIVSADAEVRDMIHVRSKLLKESQQLLLEF